MAGIFINYRTDDDASAAALVDRELCREFGSANVFRDCRSLPTGRDFAPGIRDALARSNVLLALVGPRWWNLRDERGRRRIDDPDDYVRTEIRHALGRPDMALIPLLLNGATLPRREELPPDIAGFADRHWAEFRARHDDADLRTLVEKVATYLPRVTDRADEAGGARRGGRGDGRHSAINITGDRHTFSGPFVAGDLYGDAGGSRG
ncbi:toll/interleukin-1 receptor domain-containing protein [Micromonospora siamensis]|uniref:TIR domain-containing protein n=1 Tax=Micromonospora siamensis TaxID=299152 RepID=A0A1C5JR56_9ACTN|nr:TIR domain-containing protein [Micromonospora siamensis]SCG72998.1 TIR domain-containing protein [Micromonospora siamensis]